MDAIKERKDVSEEVIQVSPVLVLAIEPIVSLLSVDVDLLLAFRIEQLCEVVRLEFIVWILFSPLSVRSLLLFQSIFLLSGSLHVSILQLTHVWA